MIQQLLLWSLIGVTAVQLFFWTVFFRRLSGYSPPPRPAGSRELPVSVVICAHNEAENLKKNLGHFLNQNYRSFEVLVVNDNSTDQTREVLLDFQANYANLRLVDVQQPTFPGKKQALATGIAAARHPVLLLSDADCAPAGPEWLATMQSAINESVEIGLGYSPYRRAPGLLNRLIRFEAVYTATQYLSFALAGIPYMGVGRNLIYTKSLFERSGGFSRHHDLLSGDDDLLVNAVAHPQNTRIILEPGAFVYSDPKSTWRGYYNQKRRHVSAGKRYKRTHQVLLGLVSSSHALHYLTALALLLSGSPMTTVFLTYLVRIGVVAAIFRNILVKLDDRSLWKWLPLLDAAFVLYYFTFAPVLLTGTVKRWK